MLFLFLESVINMSLCILAINRGKLEETKKKILDKYQLPKSLYSKSINDIYNWTDNMRNSTSKKDYDWVNNHAKQIGFNEENANKSSGSNMMLDLECDLDDIYMDASLKEFNIGYGGFYLMRQKLAPLYGARYYYAKYDSEGHPDLDSYMFTSPSEWDNSKTGNALFKFFMHSDCDGQYSAENIKLLNEYNKKHNIKAKAKKISDVDSELVDRFSEFLDFIDYSAKNDCYWDFC